MIPGTVKPCNFTVRGINSGGWQPECKKWFAAADKEDDNLQRFGVYELVCADAVPLDKDIFDTMPLCKRKCGKDNVVTGHKVCVVLCGNQVVASAKKGLFKTTVDMRTHSPAICAPSLKCGFAVGVLDDLRQRDFDVEAAYLQGVYVDRRVFCRTPVYLRKYDERGVEYVWLLKRALYGGPDSDHLWYNTYAHYMMHEEKVTPFQRCYYDPCAFTHFVDGSTAPNGAPTRIVTMVYVDDGRTWDNCAALCDGFYSWLQERFAITTSGAGLTFMIGMDISMGEGWLKITSSTYIRSICVRWLDYPIEGYDYVGSPTHPKLMELYGTGFLTRGNTPAELGSRYRYLVGGRLIFPGPTTRPDCLFTVGVQARAVDFGTEDLFRTALHCLVFMGQTHGDGISYTRGTPGGRVFVQWSDSDWAVRRSTTGPLGS